MFPQYLPNRLALTYARASIWSGAREANRILTVSEASKRDILRFFDVPPEKITSSTTPSTSGSASQPAEEDDGRACASATSCTPFVLYAGNIKPHKNLERLIEAFHLVRRRGLDHLKLVIIGDEISKYPALRRAVHRIQAAQARALPRLPAGRDAGRALPPGARVRVPVALRRLRPAAARGDGQRHAGRDLERLVAARGGGRRGGAGRSVRPARHRRRHPPRADRRGAAARAVGAKGLGARRQFSWAQSVRPRSDDIYGEVAGEPRDARRPRPRLADRHARRREGARGPLRAVPGRRPVHAGARAGAVSSPTSSAAASIRRSSSGCRRPAGSTATTCRSSRSPSSSSTSTASTWSSARSHCAAKSVVAPGRARHLCYCFTPDALRLGSVRRLFRAGAAGRRRAGLLRPVLAPAGAVGSRRRRAASTAMWLFLSMLRGRIRRYYNREAAVVYPPVDTDFFHPTAAAPRAHTALGGVGAGALQAHRRRDRGLPGSPACR